MNLHIILIAALITVATSTDFQAHILRQDATPEEQTRADVPPGVLPSVPWAESKLIHLINDAMTNYTPQVIGHYISGPVAYFGKLRTYPQIKKDILSDSQIYDINECIYKESTFRHLAISQNLTRDSIEVYNYVRERRNHRLHQSHCLISIEYGYRGTIPSISSIDLKVLPGGL